MWPVKSIGFWPEVNCFKDLSKFSTLSQPSNSGLSLLHGSRQVNNGQATRTETTSASSKYPSTSLSPTIDVLALIDSNTCRGRVDSRSQVSSVASWLIETVGCKYELEILVKCRKLYG
jgi:hypothetical protein